MHADDRSILLDSRREAFGDRRPRIVRDLLHTEGDALVLGIHVEDDDFEVLTLLDDFGRVLDPLGPAHVRNVYQAIDSWLDLNERTERGQVADRTGQLGAGRVLHRQRQPRVLFDLFHTERNLLVVRIDLEDHSFDLFTNRHDLRGVTHVARPRHLGDVHETLDALLELDEGTVVRDRDDLPLHT